MKNLTDIELINKKHQQERAISNLKTLMLEDVGNVHTKALNMITNEMARRVGDDPAQYF